MIHLNVNTNPATARSLRSTTSRATPLLGALVLLLCPTGNRGLLAADNPFPIDRSLSRARDLLALEPSTRVHREPVSAPDPAALGLVADGTSDNTSAFHRILATAGKTIVIPAGNYVTSGFTIPSGTTLVLQPGVVLIDAGKLNSNERLINILGEHITVEADGAKLQTATGLYSDGEQRHGVFIYGAHDVLIQGLESSGHAGDGFYVGGPKDKPSTDVRLLDCVATGNWRQGLSVTNAVNLTIEDSRFLSTAGKVPAAGIDFEPNYETDELTRVLVIRAQTDGNAGGGILLWLNRLTKNSKPVDVNILDHVSSHEEWTIRAIGPRDVRGQVRYVNSADSP